MVPGSAGKVRGVVTGVPEDISMEEFVEVVSGGDVVGARRLGSRALGLDKVSPTVLLEFGGPLPRRVYSGCLSFYVREYVPSPLRCFNCQRMGHVAAVCRGQGRCGRCGGAHEYGKCGVGAVVRCCNCGGGHSAAFGGCVVQQKAAEAQRVKLVDGVTYAEAVRRVGGLGVGVQVAQERAVGPVLEEGECERRVVLSEKCKHECVVGKDTLVVGRVEFLAFLCSVVNVCSQVKGRNARIDVVVGAARDFMGVIDVTGEMVHELMKGKGTGEGR
ncbi:hypothetical protein UPYG_G00209270 [Umbra pygmaea]|uniref:CCHC-type domain-containing protein n=1 Tax=Umbra pygmaea TaxID=75934 RepID=A0ABD0WKA4_UMBPY